MASRALLFRVASVIADHQLWERGDRVAVAVSGGMDSVVLLDLLLATQGLHGGRLSVVSVNHGTRDGSADDLGFVQALATSRGLECAVFEATLGAGAAESACRAFRYACFEQLDVDVVALGHHQRDQLETFFINLLRGTGLRGLSGMRHRRGRFVRPLLTIDPNKMTEWAVGRRLDWVVDPTNATDDYLRNRVRHRLLPLVEELRDGSHRSICRSMSCWSEDDRFLETLAEALDLPVLLACDLSAHPRPVLRRLFLLRFPPLTHAEVDRIFDLLGRSSGALSVSGGRKITLVDGVLSCVEAGQTG